jgi:ATP-dependent Clp protease protease subunit
MSAGFMILICGHKRFAHKLSTPLYHQVSSGAIGTAKEIEEKVVEIKRLQDQLESIVKEKTDISKKKLREIFDTKKDWYMTSEEALELNVVDEILK